jgi:hypothetical protein
MTSRKFLHTEIADLDVRRAFSSWGKAGRVVSGLLKAAAKRGEIRVEWHSGRVSGDTTWYVMSDEQLAEIRAAAINRGDRQQPLRERLCTPVSIQQAADLLA